MRHQQYIYHINQLTTAANLHTYLMRSKSNTRKGYLEASLNLT